VDPYSNNSCIDESKAKNKTGIYKEKYHVNYSCQASVYYGHSHLICRALFVHEGVNSSGLPRSGRSQGKLDFIQGQGVLYQVRKFLSPCLRSVKSQGILS